MKNVLFYTFAFVWGVVTATLGISFTSPLFWLVAIGLNLITYFVIFVLWSKQ